MTGPEIYEALWPHKVAFKPLPPAFCTTTRPVRMTRYAPTTLERSEHELAAGTTLRIVMVSRFGDFGLTDDLDATHGYGLRLDQDSEAIADFRWTKEASR